jgi:soluble lytic murein transglycosylase-like protein
MTFSRTEKFDYRLICPCQAHGRRRSIRALASAAASQLRRRAVTLIVGVPLAVCAFGLPGEAMDVKLPALAARVRESTAATTSGFHIFTTPKSREVIMQPAAAPQRFTLDLVKEQYFKNEVPYGAIIYREARKNNLAPELVAAIIESESDFRAHLVSNKQAQGLMQIVPETGRLLGCDNPFNPSQNIAAGTKYLRYLLNRFGDERTALAAYNAGEGNVERFGGIPPFTETTNYLQRVSYRTRQYRQRVNNRYVSASRMQATLVE